MTEPPEALYRDQAALKNAHLSHGIERRHPGAKKWRDLGRVKLRGDPDCRLGAKSDIFGISTVHREAVDLPVDAGLEEAALARSTSPIMTYGSQTVCVSVCREPSGTKWPNAKLGILDTSVPCASDAFSFFEADDVLPDGDNVTNDLVS